MVASWMVYSLIVAGLLGLGAVAVERGLRDAGLPGRWAWVAALVGSLIVPVVSLLLVSRLATDPVSVTAASVSLTPQPVAGSLHEVTGALDSWALTVLESLGAPLLRLWAGASLTLLAFLGAAAIRLRMARRDWREETVEGAPVLVSPDLGPAVVGFSRIVLPEWVLEREKEARSLILAHEVEHLVARDPLLVFLGALPAVLLPWNLLVWWQLRRLRTAVELDCDRRVVGRESPGVRRRYGKLLLEVGQRASARSLAALPAFSERRSGLARRIRSLTAKAPEHPVRRAVVLGSAGILLVTGACLVPSPDAVSVPTAPEEEELAVTRTSSHDALDETPTFTPYTVAPRLTNPDEVRRALVEEYPPLLRDAGIGGTVRVHFFIDETGSVEKVQLDEASGHEVLDEAALRVAGIMRFAPALNRDDPVPVWISLPLRFQVDGGGSLPTEADEPPAPAPDEPGSPDELRAAPSFTPYTTPPSVTNGEHVQRVVQEAYPPLLRDAGIGGTARVHFLVSAGGTVERVRIDRSSGNDALDEAALQVARAMEFSPALNRDERVTVWISLPITFGAR